MLLCSCNMITKQEVEEVIQGFLQHDPWVLITPARVYHALQKRGRCFGCFPNVINIIVAETENFHRQAATPDAEIVPFISQIREEHQRCETARLLMREQKLAERRKAAARS